MDTPGVIGNILVSCSDIVRSSVYLAEKDLTKDMLGNSDFDPILDVRELLGSGEDQHRGTVVGTNGLRI